MDSTLAERYGMDATDQEMMSLSYKILQKYQNRDKTIQNKVNYVMLNTQYFCDSWSHNIELATHNGKIHITKILRKNVIDW